jgi:hypothetical protein
MAGSGRRGCLLLLAVALLSGGALLPPVAAAADETVFELAAPVQLDEVADVLADAGVEVTELHHSGLSEGGYVLGDQPLAEALESYRAFYLEERHAEPQIDEITVAGAIATEALGGLAPDVTAREEITPAAGQGAGDAFGDAFGDETAANDPLGAALFSQDAQREAGAAIPPAVLEADAVAASAPRFAPLFGRTRTETRPSPTLPDQRIGQSMTWAKGSLEAFDRNVFLDHAYEHDFKLYNPDARDRPAKHPFCIDEKENHWALRKNYAWDTDYPRGTKPYFDENTGDRCAYLDFTIGIKFPKRLKERVTYRTVIRAPTADLASERYSLVAQKLSRICPGNPRVCAVRNGGESQLLIGNRKGRAPECRRWRKGHLSRKGCGTEPPIEPPSDT